MKSKRIMDATDNNSVYKKAYREYLDRYEGVCPFCPPHKGCNFWRKGKKQRNWKRLRKNQWKN